MSTFEIRHTWDAAESKSVVEKVQGAIAMAKAGKIPAGFRPISINAVPGATEAHCVWEAPSAEGLETVYRQLALPTRRTVVEVTPLYSA